jgi:hypothetical protein
MDASGQYCRIEWTTKWLANGVPWLLMNRKCVNLWILPLSQCKGSWMKRWVSTLVKR